MVSDCLPPHPLWSQIRREQAHQHNPSFANPERCPSDRGMRAHGGNIIMRTPHSMYDRQGINPHLLTSKRGRFGHKGTEALSKYSLGLELRPSG